VGGGVEHEHTLPRVTATADGPPWYRRPVAREAKLLLLFIGGGLAIGAGLFATYFFLGSKAENRDAARAPIAAWSERWQAARACYLGKVPGSPDPAEALLIRELMGEKPRCSLAELGIPEGKASGIEEIEAAWADEDKAWHTLVKAQGKPADMGPAITALDRIEHRLRAAVGLADAPAPKTAAAPAELVAGAPVAGSAGVAITALETTGHAMVGDGLRGSDAYEIAAAAPDRALVRRVPPDTLRAPDGTWAAVLESGAGIGVVTAGPTGDDGEVGDGAATVVKGDDIESLLAALGTGNERAVVVQRSKDAAIVRSHDGGAAWGKPTALPGVGEVDAWTDILGGTGYLMLPQADGQYHWLMLTPPAGSLMIGRAVPERLGTVSRCSAGTTLWWVDPDREEDVLHRSDAAADVAITTSSATSSGPIVQLLACTGDAAAVALQHSIHRCTTAGCDAGVAPGSLVERGRGFVDVFDGSGLVYARQSGRLIGVWRTGVAPRFVRAPAGATLVGVAVWKGVPTFALTGSDGLRFAPLP
jgi:hypothetical protein